MRTNPKTRRLELDAKLKALLEGIYGEGNAHLYFQPPEGFKLKYPCIVYQKDTGDHKFADNKVYSFMQAYQLTFMSKDPDNVVVDTLLDEFKYARYGRNFKVENINHDVVILYY